MGAMHRLSLDEQTDLLPHERDAAEGLLNASRRVAHSLKLGFWPKDQRLAEFEAAIQEYARASSKKD